MQPFAAVSSLAYHAPGALQSGPSKQTMYVANYDPATDTWSGSLQPYGPMEMYPSAQALNYGQVGGGCAVSELAGRRSGQAGRRLPGRMSCRLFAAGSSQEAWLRWVRQAEHCAVPPLMQAVFEGMKAQRSAKDRIVLFRPDANAERLEVRKWPAA